jgi:hypothetical protein
MAHPGQDESSDDFRNKGYACIAPHVHGKKNAHLIAAAPDMLEALRNLENDDGSVPAHAWVMVQNAIAKAEGR